MLAGALLRLRGLTLNAVAAATGIRAANLSVWLRGKEQVISAARVTSLLYHLGIEGGRLRNDVLHQWADSGPLDQLSAVCKLLQAGNPQAVMLFQDDQPGLTKTCFLKWEEAWIRLAVTPDATGAGDVAAVTQAQRVITLPVTLAGISADSVSQARTALLKMASTVAVDIDDEELLDGLMHRLSDSSAAELTFDTASAANWAQLENALRSALRGGFSPAELARLITGHCRGA